MLFFWLLGMWDLNSLIGDRIPISCIGGEVLTTGPPRKSQFEPILYKVIKYLGGLQS